MVFGDNVRARKAARALPRTPTQRRKEEDKKEEKTVNQHYTPHTITPPAIPQ